VTVWPTTGLLEPVFSVAVNAAVVPTVAGEAIVRPEKAGSAVLPATATLTVLLKPVPAAVMTYVAAVAFDA